MLQNQCKIFSRNEYLRSWYNATLLDCSVLSGPKYKIMLDLNDSLDKTALMIDLMSLNLEYWNHDNEQGMSFVTFVTFDMVTNIDYSLYYSL